MSLFEFLTGDTDVALLVSTTLATFDFPQGSTEVVLLAGMTLAIFRPERGQEMPTVRDTAEAWLGPRGRPAAAYLKKHRRKVLERYVLPRIGHLRTDRINQRRATEIQVELFDAGLSAASVRHVVSICSSLFRFAYRHGLTKQNPFLGLDWDRERRARPDVFSEAELVAILRHFRSYSAARWFVWVSLLAATGARPSEIAGLQWDDSDLRAATLDIKRGLVAREETAGKTYRSPRVIGITDHIVELLKESRPRGARGRDWICFGPDGRPIDSTNWAASKWRPQLRVLGIRPRRLYLLRHTYASMALSAGAPLVQVAAHMGTSVQKLSEVYAAWIGDRPVDPLMAARRKAANSG
ncbi:MAG TPA: tyrosine-type recombinase/integrase [Candidatus Binatia bacterium]|nr:tyrosine-type recombinase/integrase [Candidatus Binatia bacterium]